MEQFQSFLAMGGYAAFVWPAYALGTLGIAGVWYMYKRTVTARQAELDRLRPPRQAETEETDTATMKEPQTGEA